MGNMAFRPDTGNDNTVNREPGMTEPVGDAEKMADRVSYDRDGQNLIRTLQILTEGLRPAGWFWTPEQIARRSPYINAAQANKYSNRLGKEGIVIAQSRSYHLTRDGKAFACALLYRYSKTLRSDVTRYGLLDDDVISEAYSAHMGLNLGRVKRRLNKQHVKQHYPMRKIVLPTTLFNQYGI